MVVPLAMTLWFSFQNYNPLQSGIRRRFAGLFNYQFFYTDPAFFQSIWNTLLLVLGVLIITVIGGIALALLIDQPIFGQGIVRILVISPFFVMPPVAALVWKNMIMHPGYGVFADIARFFGAQPVDWFAQYPLFSIIMIVAWQWLPFATLILLTALQSLDLEQKEAAEMDGANFVNRFIYLTLPHMSRAITVVILIQTIFLLGVYAEILVTTNGGPGYASTNLPFLIYKTARLLLRRGRGRRRRNDRGYACQHRRLLPDARRRQELGQVRRQTWHAQFRRRPRSAATIAAWTVALLIFFPILYTIITSIKTEPEAIAGFNLIPSFTFESYVEVQTQRDYFKPFMNSVIIVGRRNADRHHDRHTRRLVDGIFADEEDQGHPDVDAVHQDDAGGGRAGSDLFDLPERRPAGFTDRHHPDADADRPADRGLDALHLFPRDPGRDPRSRAHGRRLAVERDRLCADPDGDTGHRLDHAPEHHPGLERGVLDHPADDHQRGASDRLHRPFSSPQGLFWAKLSAASTLAIAPILIMGWFSQKQLVRGLTFGAVK